VPRSHITRQPLHAWLILAIGLFITPYFAHEVKQRTESDAVERFAFAADQITLRIEERLGTYALMLRSASGLFDASEDVTREEWRIYWEKLRVSHLLTGVQGIGFAQLIPPQDLESHIAGIRAEGFDEYTVRPAGDRALYSAIIYLEPFSGRNLRAFGYDMFSEPVRQAAMANARDTGMAALSGKVELVQETDVDVQPGTLMYVPVYAQGAPRDTVEQRRAALIGWTYSPYRMNDLMEGILGNWERIDGQGVGLRLYDGSVEGQNLLFRNHDDERVRPASLFHQQRSIDFNGHIWALEFDHLDPANGLSHTAAWATLLSGTALTALLFALLFNLSNTQARALRIADQLTLKIRDQEAELRDSESRWRFAIEGSGDGLWDWNPADNSVFFSRQWKAMLGYADEEIAHRLEEWETRVHPEDKDRTLALVQACLEGSTPEYTSEHRMRCKDGSWKWILDRGMVLSRDADGRPLRVIGTHTDITPYKELESERERLLQRLQTLTNRVPGMVYEYQLFPDGRTCFPYASDAIRQIYKVSPEEVRDTAAPVLEILHPDDAQRVMNSILASASSLTPWRLEYRVRFRDGRVLWLYGDALPHREADGSTRWYGYITDITERKEAEIALLAAHAEAQRFRVALDYVSSYIYMKDTRSRYTYANRATLELFGCDQQSLAGSDDERFFPLATARHLREIDRRVFAGEQTSEEVETLNANGQYRVYLEIKTPIRDESDAQNITGLLGISTDITEIKEHERQLEHIAHYDALTNLPNRVLLADRLNQAMAQAKRRARHLAVVYLDLDGFKSINDRHGHAIGDKMLMALSRNMLGELREEDTLSRLGGDEFVAVLLDLTDTDDCVPMITRLLNAAASPMPIDGQALQVSASVGVTFYPQSEEIAAEQLLRQADQAMYQAKLAGKGRFHLFDAEMDRSVRSLNEHLERLRSALQDQELVLYYQPKVNMRSGKVIGAEALIRWQHPKRGLLPPAEFLPIIEDSHLAVEVGEWVIRSALDQMRRWQAVGLTLPVSINVSAGSFARGISWNAWPACWRNSRTYRPPCWSWRCWRPVPWVT